MLTSRLPNENVFNQTLLENKSGFVSVLFEGSGAKKLFKNEPGGHRWQRTSPTEKRGRVHTSTVTVAVLDPETNDEESLDYKDIKITTARGTGPGGQHQNTTDSCVVIVHLPTKISVKINSKSQIQNKKLALRILAERISERKKQQEQRQRSKERKEQVGSGMRGDKIRTYRVRDNKIIDHITGKKWRLNKWMRGEW